jgi:small subunit ribosomal protein S10
MPTKQTADKKEKKQSTQGGSASGGEEKAAAVGARIRIKVRSYDNKIIDNAVKTIVDTAERNNAKIVGPVPLPTERNKFSVNRSTFVHKTSGEQYEMRTHKRLIDILDPTPKAIDALMNLNLPSGVDVEIKMS